MSLSWRNRIIVALGPSRLALAVVERGWRTKSKEPVVLQCNSANGEPKWQALVATLRAWLQEAKPKNTDIELIVSNHFARFALIPWSNAVRKQSELATLAKLHFEALFSASTAGWEIQVDMSEYSQPGIGCALETEFTHTLRELSASYDMRLVSLQPNFIYLYNRWRSQLGNDGIFAVVEPSLAVLGSYQKGTWNSLRSVSMQCNIEESLSILLKREVLLQCLPSDVSGYLSTVEKPHSSWLASHQNVKFLDSTERAGLQDMLIALALIGAD